MEKKNLPKEHIRWFKYCAEIAWLGMFREEGIIDNEEHLYLLQKIRDKYRDIIKSRFSAGA